MKMRNVKEMSGCKYIEVTDEGLVIEQGGSRKTIEVRHGALSAQSPMLMICGDQCDTVVVCAGQEPRRDLYDSLKAEPSRRSKLFMIGGAHEAGELDAKRAIDQGTR